MNVTEEEIAPSILASIEGAAGEGADLIGVQIDRSPAEIVAAINAFVSTPPERRSGRIDKWTDRSLPLGSLWGRQLVRRFGWEWSSITFHDHDGSKAVGVFSQDRSLAVYPFHFVFGCLENQAPVTILLSFNMLEAGTIPARGRRSTLISWMASTTSCPPPKLALQRTRPAAAVPGIIKPVLGGPAR